jgi:hypothetical protein
MTQSNRPTGRPAPAAPSSHASEPETSWALAGIEPFSREEPLARYRRQRTAPPDPFASLGKAPGASASRGPARLHDAAPETEARNTAPRLSLNMGQTFAIAAAAGQPEHCLGALKGHGNGARIDTGG